MYFSKNKQRKYRRHRPDKYYEYLFKVFRYSSRAHFEANIDHAILHENKSISGEFVEYCKRQDPEMGKMVEAEVNTIIQGLMRYKANRNKKEGKKNEMQS